jgi:anthranilate phosphoribosyltransferase
VNSLVNGLTSDPGRMMRSIIKRIATGPELSQDISLEEARAGMRLILDGQIDPVQAGVFLIALRMKRETDDENRGILAAIREVTDTVVAPVDDVIDIADPYDGYNRTLPAAPFLPAVLSACGAPAVSHGVESMGPKYGVTHRQIIRAAGAPVDYSTAEAASRLGAPHIGWAYVDQRAFCPKLHDLTPLRTLIVKRPAITTVEVLAGPIRGRRKTHLVTGYVHKPYPRIYALLARYSGFDSALIVRGVEGGVIPSLRQTGKVFYYHDKGDEQPLEFTATDLGFEEGVRPPQIPGDASKGGEDADDARAQIDTAAAADAAARAGLEALDGRLGPMHDALVCAAAPCLWHLKRYKSLKEAADAVRRVLKSGEALKRFQQKG